MNEPERPIRSAVGLAICYIVLFLTVFGLPGLLGIWLLIRILKDLHIL